MEIGSDEPEHVLCKRWRVDKMELTREQLSTLTGFSASMIKDYERPNRTIDENARQRYRLACAAVQYGIEFDWNEATMTIAWPIQITTLRKS
jgi:transcriptional regulator with XRE-family HTH domain